MIIEQIIFTNSSTGYRCDFSWIKKVYQIQNCNQKSDSVIFEFRKL